MRHFAGIAGIMGLMTAMAAMAAGAGAGARAADGSLPPKVSLLPEYARYGLAAQTQRGDTCWAYSVIGCLDLEFSRARKTPTPLSTFYLLWAAATADKTATDRRGSNFGRATRALSQFGVAPRDLVKPENERRPLAAEIPQETVRDAVSLGRGIAIDWIRFWKAPPGLTEAEMESVKRHIAEGHPVAVGLRWPKRLTVEDKELCLVGTCRSLDETFDGHCVALVGYQDDPSLPGGGAFLIRNSWGAKWMDQGYGRLSYAYLRSFANDAVSFHLSPDSSAGLQPTGRPPSNVTEARPASARQ